VYLGGHPSADLAALTYDMSVLRLRSQTKGANTDTNFDPEVRNDCYRRLIHIKGRKG
jgi:hypothetical protein